MSDERAPDDSPWQVSPEQRDLFDEVVGPGWDEDPKDAQDPAAELDFRAGKALRKISYLQREIERNQAVAAAEITRVQTWLNRQNARAEGMVESLRYYLQTLAQQYEHRRAFDPGARSRSLPWGRIGYRRSPDRIEILDNERAVAWSRENGIPVKEVPAAAQKSAIQKWLRSQPAPDAEEAPPPLDPEATGVHVLSGQDQFYVDPPEEKAATDGPETD